MNKTSLTDSFFFYEQQFISFLYNKLLVFILFILISQFERIFLVDFIRFLLNRSYKIHHANLNKICEAICNFTAFFHPLLHKKKVVDLSFAKQYANQLCLSSPQKIEIQQNFSLYISLYKRRIGYQSLVAQNRNPFFLNAITFKRNTLFSERKKTLVCQASLKFNDLFFSKSIFFFKRKWSFLQKDFSKMLCLLLLGFFTGNIFGSFLNTIRQYLFWDGFITFGVIAFLEFISYLTYRQTKLLTSKAYNTLFIPAYISQTWFKFANLFKIGLLIGFFVDAFKVGS